MIEYVYRPVRIRKGQKVQSAVWCGRYSLGRGRKPVTVALHVTDKQAAEAKLRALVVEREREEAGIIAPRAIRDAAAALVDGLVTAYVVDLRARTTPAHATESEARIRRVLVATGWKRLADVTPSSWVAFRASFKRAAKTVKEYQTSVMAWLNWLVRMDMALANPLAKVGPVKIKGKAVRKSRAFTAGEFSALLAVAPAHRRIVYLFLGYTGARKNEARSLVWPDLHLGDRPAVLFREEETKSAVKRAVPIKRELAAELCKFFGLAHDLRGVGNSDLVFPVFPSDDALHADLRRAGVERKDATGRVLHFHAFRKTFQTWGAVAGVGQRSAQEMLGHSDPSLTAGAYTDVAALQLHDEVAKLPWLGSQGGAPKDAQSRTKTPDFGRFKALLGELETLAKVFSSEEKQCVSSVPSLAARHGFEP